MAVERITEEPQPDWWNAGVLMTNYDMSIEPEAEKLLKRQQTCGEYTAWNFLGNVWFDQKMEKYKVSIYRHHSLVATYAGDSLRELMVQVSEDWGYD